MEYVPNESPICKIGEFFPIDPITIYQHLNPGTSKYTVTDLQQVRRCRDFTKLMLHQAAATKPMLQSSALAGAHVDRTSSDFVIGQGVFFLECGWQGERSVNLELFEASLCINETYAVL